jgi:hypothetical protein
MYLEILSSVEQCLNSNWKATPLSSSWKPALSAARCLALFLLTRYITLERSIHQVSQA